MRAVHVPESGQPPVLGEIPTPSPSAGEVLVRVLAAGLNPLDNHIAAGALRQMIEHRYPLVLGRDASGVVEAVGAGVHHVAVGDAVLGHVPFTSPFQAGTLAELALVPGSAVAPKPQELDFVPAAALPLAGGTALALVEAIHPAPGQLVLVNGASGGVGRLTVQLLARSGVTVVATSSPGSAARMRELGAAEVLDYTLGPVDERVRSDHPDGVDALINLTGRTLEEVPTAAVRAGGTIRTITQVPDDDTLAARGFAGGGLMTSPDRDDLAALAEQVVAGDLLVDVSRVLPVQDAQQGLADLEAGKAHGKIVIDLTL